MNGFASGVTNLFGRQLAGAGGHRESGVRS